MDHYSFVNYESVTSFQERQVVQIIPEVPPAWHPTCWNIVPGMEEWGAACEIITHGLNDWNDAVHHIH